MDCHQAVFLFVHSYFKKLYDVRAMRFQAIDDNAIALYARKRKHIKALIQIFRLHFVHALAAQQWDISPTVRETPDLR